MNIKLKGTMKSFLLVTSGIAVGLLTAIFLFNPISDVTADEEAEQTVQSAQVNTETQGIPISNEQNVQAEPALLSGQRENGEMQGDTQKQIIEGKEFQLQESFNQVAQKVLPSVVELRVTSTVKQNVPRTNDIFPWFFGVPEEEAPSREFETQSLGSGVIFRKEGDTYYVLTNNHVTGEADAIEIVLNDSSTFSAEIIGGDERRDLAVVSFSSDKKLPTAALGDSDTLQVGDWVLAMGSPYGYISSVTSGIVSALGRSGQQINNINDFIQTDAAINQGNSGGPLVNLNGEVIGINTWIAAPSGGNIGLGFAIPINNVKSAAAEIIEFGSVEDGWLGVSMNSLSNMPESFSQAFDIEDGIVVMNIFSDSPAYKGGIRAGDVITKFDGTKVNTSEAFSRLISDADIRKEHTVSVNRFGKSLTFSINLAVRKSEIDISQQNDQLWPGVLPMAITDDLRKELNLSKNQKGAAVYFMANSENTKLYTAGLRNLDVITKINDTRIESIEDFYTALNDEDVSRFNIEFLRNGYEYYIGVKR